MKYYMGSTVNNSLQWQLEQINERLHISYIKSWKIALLETIVVFLSDTYLKNFSVENNLTLYNY